MLHEQSVHAYASLRSVRLSQVPTEGFLPEEGEDMDDSPLTVAVSCLMSYEHTGVCAPATRSFMKQIALALASSNNELMTVPLAVSRARSMKCT